MVFTTTKRTRDMLTDEELSILYYELSQLNQSGISWTESASLLLNDNPSRHIRLALEVLRLKMIGGSSFTAVLQATELFPSYCTHMLEIGELTGRLDIVLAALSDYYKQEYTLNGTIQQVVTYPCVMTALTAPILLILLRRISPIFLQVFSLFDSGMSPAAPLLLGQDPASLVILAGAAVALFLVAVLASILFHSRWGLAAFSRGRSSAAIGRAWSAPAILLMVSSGLGMDETLEQIGKLLEETPLVSMCVDRQKRVNDGALSTEAVTGSGIFPRMEAGILTMRFRVGTMGNATEGLVRRSQLNADMRLDQSLNRLEHGLVILLCVTVGSMLLAVMLLLLWMLASLGS